MRRTAPKIKRTKHSSANDRLGAGADGQLQEDMLDVRFHRLRRDLEGPSDVLIGRALADHCEDLALAYRERIDAAAELRIAVIPPRKQASHETGNLV